MGVIKNISLRLAYDGTEFYGFQRQSSLPSVQQRVEEALSGIYGRNIRIYGAARTDSGVHARGQVVNFYGDDTIPVERLPYALKGSLPPAIVVLSATLERENFSVRHDNKGKHYRYTLINDGVPDPFMLRYAWYIRKPLNCESMKEAASYLKGTHDFSAFEGANTTPMNPVKTMYGIFVVSKKNRIIIDVVGSGFLYHMVRNMAGALVDVGMGRKSSQRIEEILKGGDRRKLGATAPAQGLCLEEVYYSSERLNQALVALEAGLDTV